MAALGEMRKFILIGILFSPIACAQVNPPDRFSLDDLQGGWWASCDDPAVEFLVDRDEYVGDFSGKYRLSLLGDILTFSAGLAESHNVEPTHKPTSFRILAATGEQLVLRPVLANSQADDWRLQSCKGVSPNYHKQPTR